MAIDYTKYGNNTPPKFQFKIDGSTGNFILETAPLEWASVKLNFSRNMFYMGVFTEAMFDGLTFIEDGKNVLKGIFDSYGVFGKANLSIKYFDYNTRTYKAFPTTYKLDFNTYKFAAVGSPAVNAVKINALPTDINSKLFQRDKTKVDITKRISIDGFQAALIDQWASLRKVFEFPEINSYYTALHTWLLGGTASASGTAEVFAYFGLTLINSDFAESQSISFFAGSALNKTEAVLRESLQDRIVTVTGSIKINITTLSYLGDPSRNTRIAVYVTVLDSSSAIVAGQTYLVDTIQPDDITVPEEVTFTINETVTCDTTQSIAVYALCVPDNGDIQFSQLQSELRLSEPFITIPATEVEAFPIYEAIERNLQLILSKQRPFYSDFFGRTDVVKDSAGNFYGSESQLRFVNLMSGLSIRGAELSNPENITGVKFRDIFKSLKSMYNLGAAIELLDGELKVRIEELEHFFADSETLDLSTRINALDIEQESLIDWQFAKLNSGYKNAEYEAVNGRGEYNTSSERTTEVPNDTSFDNVSPYRADTRGITILLDEQIRFNGSEDVKGEADIFIVKSQEDGLDWDAETDENIQVLNDTSLFQDGSLNLYFTPTRNLLRHDYIFRAGMDGALGSKILFQSSEKLSTLETTDGADNVIENQDIEPTDLSDPLWDAIALNVEVDFYQADYQTLKADPKGYITLADGVRGWILDLTWIMADNKAQIKLLKKWD